MATLLPSLPSLGWGAKRGADTRELLDDVDALLDYIGIVKTPEMDAVRGSLEGPLWEARRALLAAMPRQNAARPERLAWAVTARRRMAVGLAAALGGGIGLLIARVRNQPRRPSRLR